MSGGIKEPPLVDSVFGEGIDDFMGEIRSIDFSEGPESICHSLAESWRREFLQVREVICSVCLKGRLPPISPFRHGESSSFSCR